MTVKKRRSAEKWLLDRSTLRRIKDRTGKDHTVHWRTIQRYAEYIPSPLEHFSKHKQKASGILILDGKHEKIRRKEICTHIAYDTGIGIVNYWIDDTENKTAYGYLYRRLKEAGYKIICLVSDGHGGILSLVDEERIPHQRCIFHILKELRGRFSVNGELKGKNRIIYSRFKHLLKSSTIEDLASNMIFFRKYTTQIFQSEKEKKLLRWFLDLLPNTTLHLSYEENVPRTSNAIENINGKIEARLKTFRGIKSEKSLNNLLKILFYFNDYK